MAWLRIGRTVPRLRTVTPRVYRCTGCAAVFSILLTGGKESKGGKGITCPLCLGKKIDEVDAIEEIGAKLAKKAFDLWKNWDPK